MRIAIVDDSRAEADDLIGFIRKYGSSNHLPVTVEYYPDANKFLFHYTPDYDCVFMDIEMPGMDGLTCAKDLRKMDRNVLLIFSTSFAQYAINGYEVDALDYLVKPYRYEDFSTALLRAQKRLKNSADCRIEIRNREGHFFIPEDSIYYVEQRLHSHVFHTDSGEYEEYGTMTSVERILQNHPAFFRISGSFIVNLKYVTNVDGSEVLVKNDSIRVSRLRKKELFQKMNDYLTREES